MLKKFFRGVRTGTTVFAIVSLAFLTACQTDTVNTVEASIDSTALAALTSQKVLLKHPCTDTVTTLCASQELLKATKGARVILINSLQTYWTSVDAYKKASKECTEKQKEDATYVCESVTTTSAARQTAYTALQAAVTGAQAILSDPAALAILSISNTLED